MSSDGIAGRILGLRSYERSPIEWTVLAFRGDRALLISRYVLDSKPYNGTDEAVTWETSTLRAWLNGAFYNSAFSEEEGKRILPVTPGNDDNGLFGTHGGRSTEDKVFLLSFEDACAYFTSEKDRVVGGTEYAYAQGLGRVTQRVIDEYQVYYDLPLTEGTCNWWLRSPGEAPDCAALIGFEGSVDWYGSCVSDGGIGIRLCIWVTTG